MRTAIKYTLWFLFILFTGAQLASATEKTPRILFIDSYHEGYAWSDGITEGILQVLKHHTVELKIHHMDSKRNRDEAFIIAAAEKARQVIDEFKPDVVIACDDNAAKYLIAPFYKASNLPIVFCGINQDAKIYGFPTRNITGMIEVDMVESLIKQLKQYTKGQRIGYLGINSLSSRRVNSYYKKMIGDNLVKNYFVENYSEWVDKYLSLQNEVDILLIGNPQGLAGWNNTAFIQLALAQTRIPTGTTGSWRTRFSLIGYIRIAEEQGNWAASTALRIIDGTPPSSIPVTHNKKGRLTLNLGMANALGITFDPALIRHADLIYPYSKKRILFIDSYHQGYSWSDGLLKGLNSILKHTGIDLKVFRLNSKLRPLQSDIQISAKKATEIVNQFKPDILIACDDNAMKHLILPYYRNASIPVVFCGINWDASLYDLPYENTTGMIEVDAINEVLDQLKRHAKGPRIGILGVNRITARKNVSFIKNKLNIPIEKTYLVDTFTEWKTAYSALQDETDMVIAVNHIGVSNWDQREAINHAKKVIKVPVGAFAPWSMHHALISYIKSPTEQGEWSASTALRILDGVKPSDIPIATNREFELVINRQLLKRLNIVFDKALYSRATFVE